MSSSSCPLHVFQLQTFIRADKIVSTSGLEGSQSLFLSRDVEQHTHEIAACTAVATEIAYREEEGICGNIEFLSQDEWVEEISLLKGDLSNAKKKKGDAREMNGPPMVALNKVSSKFTFSTDLY